MSRRNQRKDHHMYNIIAYKNQISGNHLCDISTLHNSQEFALYQFVPSEEIQKLFKDECVVLIGQTWEEHLPAFSWMKEILPPYIAHENIDGTRQKTEKNHLGLVHTNENNLDEMQDIVQDIHKYVPKEAPHGSSLWLRGP